jgi:hypothetical protein
MARRNENPDHGGEQGSISNCDWLPEAIRAVTMAMIQTTA